MTSTTAPTAHFEAAGLLLDALVGHDFDRFEQAMDPDVSMEALLPRGFVEWAGAPAVAGAFRTWFGPVEEFEVVDATVGQVGDLVQLRWRVRVVAEERFGPAPMVAEQHLCARLGPRGRIDHLRLLCSGFWPEHGDA